MSISEPRAESGLEQRATTASKRPISFPELFVVLNGCLPLAMVAFDARNHQLGPDPIRNALHTTGMVGLLLLVATLAVTPLRRLTGYAGLFFYRRPLGLVAFLYGFAHVGIYVVYDRASDWQDAWNELLQRRYLQVGAVALLTMVPLALTSTPRMVQWLGFDRWKLLHRLIYVSAIAAVAHYYMETKADTRLPISMSLAVAGLLIVRILAARRRSKSTVVSNTQLEKVENGLVSHRILFSTANHAVSVDATTTVLEAAESIGIALPFECRAGVCGQCKSKLIAGVVSMESDEALSVAEATDGWILACQACPRSDIVVKF